MNPTAAATEATTQAIERYLADNPGNEPLNALGMTADGRIVRLAEQDEGQRPEMRQVFEHQLGALMPQEVSLTDRYRMIKNTLGTEQTLRDYQKKIWWDRQIRNRLAVLKSDYADKFAIINKQTRTVYSNLGKIMTRGSGVLEDGAGWECDFENKLTRTHWEFYRNYKTGKAAKHVFYMSNLIVHQFEQTARYESWLLELPTIIERCGINNRQTIECLVEHKDRFDSDAFVQAFLGATVNGKSTVRVAQDLGLMICGLDVFYDTRPVERIDWDIDPDEASGDFSVQVHVSPDPKVYGAP
ncbi:hypothetical protein J7438_20640 [Thalassotalea sp. G20_0]|uniref:hypothetical protein n=1 Tax=Thalassotalea sp. G20_0 TaxID=2821093 RepID=UPI001ADBB9B1|nr:hypothetical protein [Thalassotalea sp. G20_0]MBO9496469.1 hypothetical protein [Thalassotalea sp. G20_0]